MATVRRVSVPLDAYVLHRYDWSETSLILDLFTRARGRVTVAAKGAKRPYSQLRSVLLPFQRIAATIGKQVEDAQSDVVTLRSAEWAGLDATPVLPPARLFAGFYLNELLMKLLARGDAHPALFDGYAGTLRSLAVSDDFSEQIGLRAFELVLLKAVGLLPDLDRVTATQRRLVPESAYQWVGDRGLVDADASSPAARLPGSDLLEIDAALRDNNLGALQVACATRLDRLKPVLRALVHYHLGSPTLRTREVMRDARKLLAPSLLPSLPPGGEVG
ncbi:MAG: DNA repair protein RecO [Caulobacter sp.]|nr:DNA repair protein RecO [Vitreoscilla sp.]